MKMAPRPLTPPPKLRANHDHGSAIRNRVSFVDVYGRNNSIQVCGERTFFSPGKSTRYRYYLAPTFRVLRNVLNEDFIIRMLLRIRITDRSGGDLPATSAQARRRHVSGDWWNYEWVSRYLAVCAFLCDERNEIAIGTQPHYRVVFSGGPISYTSCTALDEVKINERQRDRKNRTSSNA